MLEVPELNAMVKEVNETQVERQEQLSDKVQFCDGKANNSSTFPSVTRAVERIADVIEEKWQEERE